MNDKSVLKSTWAAAFTVASVWFGTHVGGGFASGNQVIQYYSNYGYTSVIFPILAMGILAIVMYIMVKFAKLSGFDNYKGTSSVDAIAKAAQDSAAAAAIASGKNRYEQLCQASQTAYNDRNPHMKKEG